MEEENREAEQEKAPYEHDSEKWGVPRNPRKSSAIIALLSAPAAVAVMLGALALWELWDDDYPPAAEGIIKGAGEVFSGEVFRSGQPDSGYQPERPAAGLRLNSP